MPRPDLQPRDLSRPDLHFTPNSGWINDPNGLIYLDGEYHLFYQHHPASTIWGPMHWGHAVSGDLLTWQELPIALAPDDIGTIFSGSAVVDRNNSAGFGANALIAIFTHDTKNPDRKQVQSLAYSTDRGRTWSKYAGNPVLTPPGLHKDFRDPKVFRYENGAHSHWVMALAVASEIWFFRSDNLKDWRESSRFGANFGSHAGVWECPELVRLNVAASGETRWVLFVSVGKGAPAGGSGMQYFVGTFDGQTFAPQDPPDQTRWVDFGSDFYAAQSWNDAPNGRKLWLGWMNNWSYGREIPDDGGRRGSMSLVRELSLARVEDGLVLVQRPVLPGWPHKLLDAWSGRSIASGVESLEPARDIEITFRIDAATSASHFGLKLGGDAVSAVTIGYERSRNALVIDRSAAGPKLPGFAAPHAAPLQPLNGRITLRVVIDRSSIEVFAADGQVVMSELAYLGTATPAVSLFAEGGAVIVDRIAVAHP